MSSKTDRAKQTKPFQSQLIPHFQLIRDMRRHRKTWREIADSLRPLGVDTSGSAIFQFFKRHIKRPAPLGFESDVLAAPRKINAKWFSDGIRPEGEVDLDFSYDDPLDDFVNVPPKKL